MNWTNLFWIFFAAAHTAAGIFYLVFSMVIYGIWEAGPWAWVVPAGCVALLALDLAGRLSLRGSGAKTLAALGFPFLGGCVELLFWDDYCRKLAAPPVLAWVFSLLLLAGYALLREAKGEAPMNRAEVLLAQGGVLGVAEAIWLPLIMGVVLFMATFGLLISLFVGGLLSTRNSLLDYCWVKGTLLGILTLHLLQSVLFCRGTRLARIENPELDNGVPLATLFLPVWNQIQAGRLARRLQMRGVKDFY